MKEPGRKDTGRQTGLCLLRLEAFNLAGVRRILFGSPLPRPREELLRQERVSLGRPTLTALLGELPEGGLDCLVGFSTHRTACPAGSCCTTPPAAGWW